MGRPFHLREKRRKFRPRRNQSNTGRVNRALGEIHQGRVGRVLLELMDKGVIRDFLETTVCDDFDRSGIDFRVTTLDGREVFIQVKSSEYYAELFRRKHSSDIAVIVSNPYVSTRALRGRIQSIVSAAPIAIDNPPS